MHFDPQSKVMVTFPEKQTFNKETLRHPLENSGNLES